MAISEAAGQTRPDAHAVFKVRDKTMRTCLSSYLHSSSLPFVLSLIACDCGWDWCMNARRANGVCVCVCMCMCMCKSLEIDEEQRQSRVISCLSVSVSESVCVCVCLEVEREPTVL